MKEHMKRKYCAVYKHSETGHHIDCDHPEIIGYDKMKIRLQIKETLQISEYSANKSLNVYTIKMKFITFALILQFLIACWPKVDIITN